jgi:thymidylate kinase
MLQSLDGNVAICLERVHQAREQAAQAQSESDRAFWLDVARKWQDLADGYEFQQRLNRFVDGSAKPDAR